MPYSMKQKQQKLPSELFHAYRRGWRDGAGDKVMNTSFIEHKTRPDLAEEYKTGYTEGRLAFATDMDTCAKRVGYDQQSAILRSDAIPSDENENQGGFW